MDEKKVTTRTYISQIVDGLAKIRLQEIEVNDNVLKLLQLIVQQETAQEEKLKQYREMLLESKKVWDVCIKYDFFDCTELQYAYDDPDTEHESPMCWHLGDKIDKVLKE